MGRACARRRRDQYEFDEDCPRLAGDGSLYFVSGEPRGKGYKGICRSRLAGDGYAPPERLPEPVNSEFGELVEAVDGEQAWLLFRSLRPGGLGPVDVYASFALEGGGWSEPVNIGEAFNKPRRWALSFSPRRTVSLLHRGRQREHRRLLDRVTPPRRRAPRIGGLPGRP